MSVHRPKLKRACVSVRAHCIALFLVVVSCAAPVQPDPDATRILFVGNSATYTWNTPEMVRELLDASGQNAIVDSYTVGGATLSDHAYLLPTREKIAEAEWDYVVLQPASYYIAFLETHPELLEPIRLLKEMIENSSPNAKVIFTLVWPWKNGITVDSTHYTFSEFQAMMRDGTIEIAKEFGFAVAPVGWAWNRVMLEQPDIDMFGSDLVHPSQSGAYLQACVYAVTILGEALNVASYGTLPPDRARYLQQIASSVVLDSLEVWNLAY